MHSTAHYNCNLEKANKFSPTVFECLKKSKKSLKSTIKSSFTQTESFRKPLELCGGRQDEERWYFGSQQDENH